jgi:hypothetical protein
VVARLAISSLAAADKPIVSARLILPPTTSAFRSTCCVRRPDASPAAVLGVAITQAQARQVA